MLSNSILEADYLQYCSTINFDPTKLDPLKIVSIDKIKKIIREEKKSAQRQGVPDAYLDGKSEKELIRSRLKGSHRLPFKVLLGDIMYDLLEATQILNNLNQTTMYSLPIPVFCGWIPKIDFNANVRKTKNGALILVYHEIFALVYNCMKIFFLSNEIVAHTSYDCTKDRPQRVASLLSTKDAVETISDLILVFLKYREALPAPYPAQGGAIADVCVSHSISTVRFVIAHEFGHILGNHLLNYDDKFANSSGPRSLLACIRSPNFKAENLIFQGHLSDLPHETITRWNIETEADQFGFDLSLAPFTQIDNPKIREREFIKRLNGSFIFFSIDELLEQVCRDIYDIPADIVLLTGHPPPKLRIQTIRGWIEQIVGSDTADIVTDWFETGEMSLILEWFKNITPEVCKMTKERIRG